MPNANGQRHFLAVLHTLGLVLALISVAVSAVWGSLEAWWLWVVGSKGSSDEVSLKGQEVRFVTSMSMHRLPILVVLSTWCFKSEQGRTARDDVRHQARVTGFLVRRGLVVGGGLCLAVDRFGLLGLVFGWEMFVVVAAGFAAGLALFAFLEVGFADELSGACVASACLAARASLRCRALR